MVDQPPVIALGQDESGHALVLPGELGPAHTMAELMKMVPQLATPSGAVALAQAANHFAHGTEYRVIVDPKAFEAAYRARIGREDPQAEWQEGVVRLRDYGLPDFGKITAPRLAGGRLVFFAEDTFLGVPYQVELTDLTGAPDYHPMPLTPLPGPAAKPRLRAGEAAPVSGPIGDDSTAESSPHR